MRKNLIILSIIVFTVNQNVICQNIDALKNMTLGKIIALERKGLDTIFNKKIEYREINVNYFKFYDFSYSSDSVKNNDVFYKLFFYEDTLKKVLFFDKIHSCKSPIYGANISYIGKYRIYFIYNMYLYQKLNWKEFNYIGFIVSDNKENLNIFFGYDNNGNFNSVEDIDRIFILDNNLRTKKLFFFKSGKLKYITEPVYINNIHQYEIAFKVDFNFYINDNTKIEAILNLNQIKLKLKNYGILYKIGTENPKGNAYKYKKYPLWCETMASYIPCFVLQNNKKENKVYFKRFVNDSTFKYIQIDNQIRGKLECFDWIY